MEQKPKHRQPKEQTPNMVLTGDNPSVPMERESADKYPISSKHKSDDGVLYQVVGLTQLGDMVSVHFQKVNE